MNSQTQRRVVHDPAPKPEPRVITPLSGPSYGAYSVVKRRWRKPIPAVVADAIANSQELLTRLSRGVYAPDREGEAHYREIYDNLCRTNRQQLEALKAFSQVAWRE